MVPTMGALHAGHQSLIERASLASAGSAGARVLVIDSHPVARELLAHMLSGLGAQAETVGHGQGALDRLRI